MNSGSSQPLTRGVAMAVSLPGPYRQTYDDWLRYPDDGYRYELIDGELIVSPPPSIRHQRISRELGFRLLAWLKTSQRGEILHAPVGVRLADGVVLDPDLVVVLTENADRVGEQVIDGPPDVVVEILSPGTAVRDLGVKKQQYEAHGVQEYWVVDPESRSIEVLSQRAGTFARAGLHRASETVVSPLLPGLSIAVDDVL